VVRDGDRPGPEDGLMPTFEQSFELVVKIEGVSLGKSLSDAMSLPLSGFPLGYLDISQGKLFTCCLGL
jgi:hypothetical protein